MPKMEGGRDGDRGKEERNKYHTAAKRCAVWLCDRLTHTHTLTHTHNAVV